MSDVQKKPANALGTGETTLPEAPVVRRDANGKVTFASELVSKKAGAVVFSVIQFFPPDAREKAIEWAKQQAKIEAGESVPVDKLIDMREFAPGFMVTSHGIVNRKILKQDDGEEKVKAIIQGTSSLVGQPCFAAALGEPFFLPMPTDGVVLPETRQALYDDLHAQRVAAVDETLKRVAGDESVRIEKNGQRTDVSKQARDMRRVMLDQNPEYRPGQAYAPQLSPFYRRRAPAQREDDADDSASDDADSDDDDAYTNMKLVYEHKGKTVSVDVSELACEPPNETGFIVPPKSATWIREDGSKFTYDDNGEVVEIAAPQFDYSADGRDEPIDVRDARIKYQAALAMYRAERIAERKKKEKEAAAEAAAEKANVAESVDEASKNAPNADAV